MKTFIAPHFQGSRFDGTLPVDVARDLAAYEDMIVALAKALYLSRNPGRKRVPNGFTKNFRLHLEKLEEGSTKTFLGSVTAAAVGLLGSDATYFENARDLIAECVRAKTEARALPAEFPRELLDYFNVFGRSLRDDESVDIAPPASAPAILTPERRRALVLDGERFYSKEVEVTGTVASTEWERNKFTIRLLEGGLVEADLNGSVRDRIRRAGGLKRTLVCVSGVGIFDVNSTIVRLEKVTDVEILPNPKFAETLKASLGAEDGWLDGEGVAVSSDLLEWVEDNVLSTFPENVTYPHVAPTPEGGIFFEWISSPWRVSAEFFPGIRGCELQATNARERMVENADLDLKTDERWQELYDFVRRFIPAREEHE